MNTKFHEISKSDKYDVLYSNVPPFQVYAVGENFSRPVGYFTSLDEAIQSCKDSGKPYKVVI